MLNVPASVMSTARYNDTRPVSAIVKDVLVNIGCLERFQGAKAKEKWVELAGPAVNSVTRNVFVHKGALYVELNSSAWRHELHMKRKSWCNKLNQALRKPVIREIIFR